MGKRGEIGILLDRSEITLLDRLEIILLSKITNGPTSPPFLTVILYKYITFDTFLESPWALL